MICAARDEMLLSKVGVCQLHTLFSAPTSCGTWNTRFVRDD